MGSHPGVSKVEGAMHHWVMPTFISGALLLSLVLAVIAALRGAWAGVLVLTSAALVLVTTPPQRRSHQRSGIGDP